MLYDQDETYLGKFGKKVYNDLYNFLDKSEKDHSIQKELADFVSYINSDIYLNTIDSIVNKTSNEITLTTPKGTIDQKPEDMLIRNYVINKIRNVLINHGVDEIDTPIFELKSTYSSESESDSISDSVFKFVLGLIIFLEMDPEFFS
jgi:histidyl-tRNA synthetase